MRIGLVGAVVIGALIYLYPPPVIRGYLYGPEPPTRKGGLLPATLNNYRYGRREMPARMRRLLAKQLRRQAARLKRVATLLDELSQK